MSSAGGLLNETLHTSRLVIEVDLNNFAKNFTLLNPVLPVNRHDSKRWLSLGYLYRGVSADLDQQNERRLRPKGNMSEVVLKVGDPDIKVDGTWRIGSCEENAVRAHQLGLDRYNGCFISTSRCKSVAEKFATSGGNEDGHIYVIDESLLAQNGVHVIERVYEENSHEKEVSLRAEDCGDLPEAIILNKYPVGLND